MNTPEHYQPILYLDPANVIGPLPYWLGAAVKYIWRAPLKNGGDDYMKAADCLRRYQQLHGFAPAPKLNLTPKTWHRARALWEKTTILGCDRATNNFHVLTLNRVLGLVLGSDPSNPRNYDTALEHPAGSYQELIEASLSPILFDRSTMGDPHDEFYHASIWHSLRELEERGITFLEVSLESSHVKK